MKRLKIEQAILDANRQQKYTRTNNYDLVVWDSRCKIKTFESEDSLKLIDMPEYIQLDKQAHRETLEG
jgi:hypothetical protein